MKQFILIFLLVAAILYGMAAFVSLKFNPSEWGDSGRCAYVIMTLIGSLCIWAVADDYKRLKH